jgi:hypothetical protein
VKYIMIFRAFSVIAMLLCGTSYASATTYDSIAVDDDVGLKGGDAGFGVGEGHSPEEAKHDALRNCRQSGNKGCEVAVTYQHCGAYASSKKHAGTGIAGTEAEAKQKALRDCGVSACRIVTSDCVGK